MPDDRPKRIQSQTERDISGMSERKKREMSPVSLATPALIDEDEETSQKYDLPEERRAFRADQPTAKRLEKLEDFKDAAMSEFADIKVGLADLRGDQKAQNVTLASIEKHLSEAKQREHVTFTSKVEVETAEKVAMVKVGEAKELDTIDARKKKRELWLKAGGLFTSGGIVFEILHRIGVL